jgi:gamma-glutamyltranspeptidase / glutathione hydrolase
MLVSGGKRGFYEGPIAEAIVASCSAFGGVMSAVDLREHVSTYDDPISTVYKEVKLWEMPLNSQGVVALMALNILEKFDLEGIVITGHKNVLI